MMTPRAAGCLILLSILSACRFAIQQEDLPAHIVNPTEQSRAELRRAVSEALHGVSVTLADDALTHDNRLIVERRSIRDAQGIPVMGIQTEKPHQFYLVKNGKNCILIYGEDDRRIKLKQTACEPLLSHE